MEPLVKINILCEQLRKKEMLRENILDYCYEKSLYSDLISALCEYKYFAFDGRFEDLVETVIFSKAMSDTPFFETYEELLEILSNQMQKWVVPTIILLPLVFVDGVEKAETQLKIPLTNENFVVFPLTAKEKAFKNKRYTLAQHVEKTIYAKLLENHILISKDSNFFNYPIMTIEIRNIPSKVEREALKIAEAAYSLIRMVGFGLPKKEGWIFPEQWPPFPATYAVYYNKVGASPEPPFDSGYGHSFGIPFSRVLDVDFEAFLSQEKLFSKNLVSFINASFLAKKDTPVEEYVRKKKWQNAVLLFNEAYELASRERFDSALLLLMAILESIFLKNEGPNKKVQLSQSLRGFLDNPSSDQMASSIIDALYRKRNAFIHEGKRMTETKTYKPPHDMNGLITGMRPCFSDNDNTEQMHNLFQLCCDVLLHYCIEE